MSYRDFLYILHPASPNVNIVHDYAAVVKTKNYHWYATVNYIFYLDFFSFSSNAHVSSRIHTSMLCLT